MAKGKKPKTAPEDQISSLSYRTQYTTQPTYIVDTHTHLISTFEKYVHSYPSHRYMDVFSFVRGMYGTDPSSGDAGTPEQSQAGMQKLRHQTKAIIDVYCEAPVLKMWREIADSALNEVKNEKWDGLEYWFVMGVHPHEVEQYTDEVEAEIFTAMNHPRCVGWGEIGLDYKVSQAPHDIQRSVFERQLRHAVRLGKPITIHTREAEEDTEKIMKNIVPRNHPIHIHCYTDSPELALRLIDHFSNLYVGITGVITYSTNHNTSNLIRQLITSSKIPLRILLETDAPYMIPSNIYRDISTGGARLPFSHTGMIPWTAEWIAKVASEVSGDDVWSTDRVMRQANENARKVYGNRISG